MENRKQKLNLVVRTLQKFRIYSLGYILPIKTKIWKRFCKSANLSLLDTATGRKSGRICITNTPTLAHTHLHSTVTQTLFSDSSFGHISI